MARGLNKVMLIGNLGADPEVRYTPSGSAVATMRVATGRRRKGPDGNPVDETEWHRVVAWDRLAEIANEYCAKGRQVYVEGRLTTRQWTDQQGQPRYTTEIVASEITLLGSNREGGDYEGAEGQGHMRAIASEGQPHRPMRRSPGPVADEELGDDFDDVPFD